MVALIKITTLKDCHHKFILFLVLEFISKSVENPTPAEEGARARAESARTKVFLQEEPLYPSAGVISRRAPLVESEGPVFELNLNITDSEFIIVADASQSDCSTVILRSTTVIAFRPDMKDRPFSCNLNNAEVFSCVLGREEESSLSIIDPVTINFEIGGRNSSGKRASRGLLDLAAADGEEGGVERSAEVQLQQLNVRLSYHDTLMFRAILASFPGQARQAMSGREEVQESGREKSPPPTVPSNVQAQISQLTALGFSREDCALALTECRGQVNEAALWLTQNASPVKTAAASAAAAEQPVAFGSQQSGSYLQGSSVSFTSVELKTSSINICIIDDCKGWTQSSLSDLKSDLGRI